MVVKLLVCLEANSIVRTDSGDRLPLTSGTLGGIGVHLTQLATVALAKRYHCLDSQHDLMGAQLQVPAYCIEPTHGTRVAKNSAPRPTLGIRD